ncbi:MAG: metal-dependent protein hydrolase [Parcubacteria group bacterium Gr01-1014_72]|nr:MAG: metal-dependent protein hydrolase [Parcubacteria group bacterium Gr01-1014_72]
MNDRSATIVTHSGNFHPDDIFAVAVLRRLYAGGANVLRSRELSVIASADFAVDVGSEYDPARRRFDHHQEGGAGVRANGIPYASFGLVWKAFGSELCGGDGGVAREIEERLVLPIDAHDNGITLVELTHLGVYPYLFQDIVQAFRPTWKEDPHGRDKTFFRLVDLAGEILEREIIHAASRSEGERFVREAYERAEDKRSIVLTADYPWEEFLSSRLEPLFVVSPERGTENWQVNAVRTAPNSFESRQLFPVTWAGKRDHELALASGVPDALFCHNKRFFAVARSREGALALVVAALRG